MPSADNVLAFGLTAFVIVVIPGPSVMFVVSRALAHGRRTAALTVIGNTLGEYVQVIAVAFGIGLLVERVVTLFTILKLAGAAYLIYLGVRTIIDQRHLGPVLDRSAQTPADRRTLRQGFVVGISNPKTVIFLAAILPEFVTRSRGFVPEQILLLGLVFSAIALVSDNLWAIAAGAARSWFAQSPKHLRLVGGLLAIIAIGIRLALSGRKGLIKACDTVPGTSSDSVGHRAPDRTVGVTSRTASRRRYGRGMTDSEPSPARTWLYRFSRPGDIEIETRELSDNDTAEMHARELSKARQTPIIIQWHDRVDWEYVTEVDERA